VQFGLIFNSFYVRPAALDVARFEFKQKLSSLCTSLNIHKQHSVWTHTAAIYISIFVKFLHCKC